MYCRLKDVARLIAAAMWIGRSVIVREAQGGYRQAVPQKFEIQQGEQQALFLLPFDRVEIPSKTEA
ncbi:hypothetical protein KS08_08860 [Bacillus subtilis]|nr:hypothetical protein KS08_08860 [Bacillus subtilis]